MYLRLRRPPRRESCRLRFFFRAGDGIRCGHVTGVQTCALPISQRGELYGAVPAALAALREAAGGTALDSERSEERRVGKECMSPRWLVEEEIRIFAQIIHTPITVEVGLSEQEWCMPPNCRPSEA